MHHLVPHSVGRNYTSTPRVMAYFRVSHPATRIDASKPCAIRGWTTHRSQP